MKYTKTILPNGTRVIFVPTRDNPSATVMVACETGSKYESKVENGLAHFLEHMLFKGTPTRTSALAISTELDAIGAESNAFTSEEVTAYYAKSEKRHWQKLLDVVSDIYLHPVFPANDLEKERGVILQEISMYEDLPQRYVWEVLGALLYGDTPAGRSTIGTKENVKSFSREDFLAYHAKHYVPAKTIVVIAGDLPPAMVLKEVKKIFSSQLKKKKVGKEKVRVQQEAPALRIKRKPSDQTHMVMAFHGYRAGDPRAMKAAVLMGILGAGMSSRLFQRLREEMGACYYVSASHSVATDHGFASIATGIDKARAAEVIQALLEECRRLTLEEVSASELQKVKDYMASHLSMSLETTDALANYCVGEEIVHGEVRVPSALEAEMRKVTAADVRRVAKALFTDNNLSVAMVGDLSDEKGLRKVLTFK